MKLNIEKLDEIYKGYNYEIKSKNHRSVRVYTQKIGIYNAAEIIPLTKNYNTSKLKKTYSDLGYATIIRESLSIKKIEDILFKAWFLDSPFHTHNKQGYKKFVTKIERQLPNESNYKYINVPFNFFLTDKNGTANLDVVKNRTLVKTISDLFKLNDQPLFVIIEAPAGFGKTCTAFEVLNHLLTSTKKYLPFFTELSKSRSDKIFKHILLSQIDNHFPDGIKSSVVLNEIKRGNIPLIIDGFDELLSKSNISTKDKFSEAENMLSTLLEVLQNKAKIIITSRKTAIFDSDEFIEWTKSANNEFRVARFSILEPTISDWLDESKIRFFEKKKINISSLSNPVMLSFLKHESLSNLTENLRNENDLTDIYFKYLLKRENIRQGLHLTPEEQLELMSNLIRFFIFFDITSESKSEIKIFFQEFCKDKIVNSIKKYKNPKPTLLDLCDTLTNHVLLDRKENSNIGIINDFVLGYLIGLNICKLKDWEDELNFSENISNEHIMLSFDSFKLVRNNMLLKYKSNVNKIKSRLNANNRFVIDAYLNKIQEKDYEKLYFSSEYFYKVDFSSHKLTNIQFENCEFSNCVFSQLKTNEIYFFSCKFLNCSVDNTWEISNNIIFESCKSDNLFTQIITIGSNDSYDEIALNKLTVLRKFVKVDGLTPKRIKYSLLRQDFLKQIHQFDSCITEFLSDGYLVRNNDVFYITKNGIKKLKGIKQ